MIYLVQFECEIHGYAKTEEEAKKYVEVFADEFDIPEEDRELFVITSVEEL